MQEKELQINQDHISRNKADPTGQIMFAAINIAVCGSLVFGVVALIFALMAHSDKDYNQAKNNLRIAKIFNITGISLSALSLFLVFVIYAGILFLSLFMGFITAIW